MTTDAQPHQQQQQQQQLLDWIDAHFDEEVAFLQDVVRIPRCGRCRVRKSWWRACSAMPNGAGRSRAGDWHAAVCGRAAVRRAREFRR
jgi:hypothetical protein